MTTPQVDFYLIENEISQASQKLCCRLCKKLLALELDVAVMCETDSQALQLDKLMWSFEDSSFLPHQVLSTDGRSNGAASTPHQEVDILVAEPDQSKLTERLGKYKVIVNLTNSALSALGLDSDVRLAEIVEQAPDAREQAREKYKLYKNTGAELKTHNLSI